MSVDWKPQLEFLVDSVNMVRRKEGKLALLKSKKTDERVYRNVQF